jgi:hypothetical protein
VEDRRWTAVAAAMIIAQALGSYIGGDGGGRHGRNRSATIYFVGAGPVQAQCRHSAGGFQGGCPTDPPLRSEPFCVQPRPPSPTPAASASPPLKLELRVVGRDRLSTVF